MSEQQMNDSTFSRLFIIMILAMSALAVILMVLATVAADGVNTRLDERSDAENSAAIAQRIAPVGTFSAESEAPQPLIAAAAVPLTGEEAYASCAACHTAGIAGAPALGAADAWTARIAQGIDTLYDHAINGYQGEAGYMPAKGGDVSLSDEAVRAAVDYMLEQVQ